MRETGAPARGHELVVSVHDVAPSTLPEVRWLLGALDGIGARPRALLVIPSEPVRPLSEDPDLIELLRSEAAAGAEIVQHGYSHHRSGLFRGPWPDRLRGRLFARHGAEFLALDPTAMRNRLERGRAELAALGLPTAGFCAPGWLAAPGLSDELVGLGFRYLVGFATVTDVARRRRILAPSGGFMGAPRDEGLVQIETGLARAIALQSPFQLFLHPQGADRSRDCARVLTLLERQLRSRRLVTYEELLNRHR